MPQEVIDRVNELGKAEGQPELLTFFHRKGRVIGDTSEPHPNAGVTTIDEDEAPDAGVEPHPNDEAVDAQPDHDEVLDALFDAAADEGATDGIPDLEPQYHNPDFGNDPEAAHEDHLPQPDAEPQQVPEQDLMFDPSLVPDNLPPPEEQTPVNDDTWVRRSTRIHKPPDAYAPSLQGTSYVTSGERLVHPDSHLDPDYTPRNDPALYESRAQTMEGTS